MTQEGFWRVLKRTKKIQHLLNIQKIFSEVGSVLCGYIEFISQAESRNNLVNILAFNSVY